MSANESDSGYSSEDDGISLSRPVRFWLLLLFDVPSVICSFTILICLLGDRTSRRALHDHTTIVLITLCLTTLLIDIPSYLAFIINSGVVKPSVPATCMMWWFVAIGIYNSQQVLIAWIAVERHIFIFYDRWLRNTRGKFFAHYLPLTLILAYLFIFYIYAFFIYPCQNTFDYTTLYCNANPCYQTGPLIRTWDLILNNIAPGLSEPIISMTLIIRVIRQKQRLSQGVQWRKHRKMVLQLILASFMNVTLIVPLNVFSLAYLFGLPRDYGAEVVSYFYFFAYYLSLVLPFIFLTSIPRISRKVKSIFQCGRQEIAVGRTTYMNNRTHQR